MRYFNCFSFLFLIPMVAFGQNYTSYIFGNQTDVVTSPISGICLMGGGAEDDNAMKWFLERADGGDVLVLRATGDDGYNEYLYTDLEVDVNSVETIVFHNSSASQEEYIHQKITQAEAIWFAGGDQWDYVSYWRGTAIDSLINLSISERNIVIGGTSAGMAILGEYYFSAQNGTVTSETALLNPYDNNITVENVPFLKSMYLENVITDSHYDNPTRSGRHVAFLARILTDDGVAARGIACDEYTAVCIGSDRIGRVFGQYPTFDDNAYFLMPNCELGNFVPENCSEDMRLEWNYGGEALRVYTAKGTHDGINTFDLNDWKTGVGGDWEKWYVANGQLIQEDGNSINCDPLSVSSIGNRMNMTISPNPANDAVILSCEDCAGDKYSLQLMNSLGQKINEVEGILSVQTPVDIQYLSSGLYFLSVNREGFGKSIHRLVIED